MASVNPNHYRYSRLISEIKNGQIKIPQFQRDFVWDLKGSAKLLDSIFKNYPIGTFIFWRTDNRLRSIRNIGNLNLPEPKEGDFITYVLDGQQRITSLFASLEGVKIKREGKYETDYSKIYINLTTDGDDTIVITDAKGLSENTYISINDLIKFDFDFIAKYSKDMRKKIQKYRNALMEYDFSVIEVRDADIDVATDIFTRINVGGRPLNLFEIMVAKTYDSRRQFDLAQKFSELHGELSNSKYETIPAATVLQALSILFKKDCTRKEILRIPKNEFIDMWIKTVEAIKSAVDYFRTYYKIPVSRLLPYNALVVPFAYYFHKNKDRPSGEIQKRIEDFFWRASLGGRYSSGVESKLASDIDKIDKILEGESIKYDWEINTTVQFIKDNGEFRIGRSYIKAILSILASLNPLSFDDGSEVIIDNSWLKRANSRNYHHFFPKKYLKDNRPDLNKFDINHIINITIVDGHSNLRIRTKAPSKYISDYKEKNPFLSEHLKTHLIGDFDTFGISNDDYDKFFNERAILISKEIEKRVILTDTDNYIKKLDEDTEPEDISEDIDFE